MVAVDLSDLIIVVISVFSDEVGRAVVDSRRDQPIPEVIGVVGDAIRTAGPDVAGQLSQVAIAALLASVILLGLPLAHVVGRARAIRFIIGSPGIIGPHPLRDYQAPHVVHRPRDRSARTDHAILTTHAVIAVAGLFVVLPWFSLTTRRDEVVDTGGQSAPPKIVERFRPPGPTPLRKRFRTAQLTAFAVALRGNLIGHPPGIVTLGNRDRPHGRIPQTRRIAGDIPARRPDLSNVILIDGILHRPHLNGVFAFRHDRLMQRSQCL